jgi:hypothetical protein
MARKEEYTVDEVKTALRASKGFMTAAAAKLGCTTQTLRNYIKRYPDELAEIMPEENEKMLDFAESKLFKQIQDDNLTAIIFFLKTRGKARGYSERLEMTGADGGAMKTDSVPLSKLLSSLDVDVKKAMLKAIEEKKEKKELQ